MATSPTNAAVPPEATSSSASLLIHLAPLAPEALEATLSNLALAFPSQNVLVALPEAPNLASQTSFNTLQLLPYSTATTTASTTRTLTAIDYVNTWKLAQENSASACLLLGAE